jgi:hypothetical protein
LDCRSSPRCWPGLPDFSWYVIPKPEKMYQMSTKWIEWSKNVSKIFQMVIKGVNILQSRALQNLPKSGFFVWKQTIWQPSMLTAMNGPGWDNWWPPSTALSRKSDLNSSFWIEASQTMFVIRTSTHLRTLWGCQMVCFQTKNPTFG